ncbi:MAG: hypothetical protein GY859_06895 [Desulfobacterales bacterium]|nr:hypothetical protein [Desulfobacterales bacterium]
MGNDGKRLDLYRWVFAMALVGLYARIHYIFIEFTGFTEKQTGGFFWDCAVGLLAGGLVGLIFYRASDARFFRKAKEKLIYFAYATCMAGVLYAGWTLFENSRELVTYSRVSSFLGKLAIFFFLAMGLTFLLRKKTRLTFEIVSVILFILAALHLSVRFSLLTAFIMVVVYMAYLIILGGFCVKFINHRLEIKNESAWEAVAVSFIFGVLVNYILWYFLGVFGCLYTPVAAVIIGVVVIAGVFVFRKNIKEFFHRRRSPSALFEKADPFSSIFFNIFLFCLLVILVALAMRFPGHEDSSHRMYLASLFRFRALHGIEFLPFSANWPLIFQPLMLEITGAPLFLAGGLSAVRIFYTLCFFSFIPFLILLYKNNQFSKQAILLFLFIYISSAFTFQMAYCDKPEVMAFPALVSFFAVCIMTLKKIRPWCILSMGPLCAIIYGTKSILIVGAFIALFILIALNRGAGAWKQNGAVHKKALLITLLIFFSISMINPVQNIILRGNPFHPFGSDLFRSSKNFPGEMLYVIAPKAFYKKTMPVIMPSAISGVNLDVEKGLYRPFIPTWEDEKVRYWHTRYTINIITVLLTVLAPVLLLCTRDKTLLFCAFTALMSFLVWFCRIGDGLRYSAYFPAITLFSAILLSGSIWPRKWMDASWRGAINILLIFSVPLALFASLGGFIPRDLQRYPFHAGKKPVILQPFSHPVTEYLNGFREEKPVLVVSDMEVIQYGFFQPNFTFLPWHMNKVSLSRLRPTHFLTPETLDKSRLTVRHPELTPWLKHEKDFHARGKILHLHRFDPDAPWDKIFNKYKRKERYSPALILDLERFHARYKGVD